MPYKTDGLREYRSFESDFAPVDAAGDTRPYTVEGYATTFDVPYDFGESGARERVLRSAFDTADMRDVIFQLNHEGQTLARQRNDSLELSLDDHGLKVRAFLGGSAKGRDLYEAIANGLIDKMSWGFMLEPDGYEWDADTRTSTITRVKKVFDVSAVCIPADQDTEIHARSYLDGVIEREQQELLRCARRRDEDISLALEII